MGNKWLGEELLRFYTFIVYNLGYLMERDYISDDASVDESQKKTVDIKTEEDEQVETISNKNESTQKNLYKRKPLGNFFYKELLEYITQRIDNPNNRQISHLRCKMSKFFFKKEDESADSVEMRWKNSMILYDDFIAVYLQDNKSFHMSDTVNSVKMPHQKDDAIIEQQLEHIFGLKLLVRSKWYFDQEMLNSVDWIQVLEDISVELPDYIDAINSQKDVFTDNNRGVTEQDLEKGQIMINILTKKNLLIEKALMYTNIHYILNDNKFDPRSSSSDPNTSSEVLSFLQYSSKGSSKIKPFESGTRKYIQINKDEPKDHVKKKLKITKFETKPGKKQKVAEPKQTQINNFKLSDQLLQDHIMERLNLSMRKNANFKVVMPMVSPLSPTNSFSKTQKVSSEANQTNFMLQKKIQGFGPLHDHKSQVKIAEDYGKKIENDSSSDYNEISKKLFNFPSISQAIVQDLATSQMKIWEASPDQTNINKQELNRQNKRSGKIKTFGSIGTPAENQATTENFDEIKTSGVRFMKGIVDDFSNLKYLPTTETKMNSKEELPSFSAGKILSGFSASDYTLNLGYGLQPHLLNSRLRQIPMSNFKIETKEDFTTTGGKVENSAAIDMSSFEYAESSYRKFEGGRKPQTRLKKKISNFDN